MKIGLHHSLAQFGHGLRQISLILGSWMFAAAVTGAGAGPDRLRPWDEYRVIMWIGDSAAKRPDKLPLFYQRLREMGVNTAMVYGADGDPQPLIANQFPDYVENIVNHGLCLKYNAEVRDWDKFVTGWAKTRDEGALARQYCLDDPQWREWARQMMRRAASQHGRQEPLAYNIRDELSVTISANPFDYDFSPQALAAFRDWARRVYGDLAALNREWETAFGSWAEVKPFTTDQIKNRMITAAAQPAGRPDWQALQALKFNPVTASRSPTRWNFAPWADFRTYMDLALADTLADLRAAAHEVDPATPVGIEGTQMPSAFGGYDLWRLAQALDWVEPYDIGNAREIFGSFMPDKALLTTVFEKDTNSARRRLWHLLLEGDRGCIIWWSEDCVDWQSAGYELTPKARALAPVLQEMTGPLARLFLRARRVYDPVAILYSQPSIQADWLLESCADGSTWLRRFSSFEADHNRSARARNSWLKALVDLGYSPRFLAATGLSAPNGAELPKVVVLPTALALGTNEVQWIQRVVAPAGPRPAGVVLADGTPGVFDEHCRLRGKPGFGASFPWAVPQERSFAWHGGAAGAVEKAGDIAAYERERLEDQPNLAWAEWLAEQTAVLAPDVRVPAAARVAVYRYQLGSTRLVALERNVNYQMSEDLKQAGGNQHLETPVVVPVQFPTSTYLYDLRAGAYLGYTNRLQLTVEPWQPVLLASLARPIEATQVVRWLQSQSEVETRR